MPNLPHQTSIRYMDGELAEWKCAAELQGLNVTTYIRLTMNKRAAHDLKKAARADQQQTQGS